MRGLTATVVPTMQPNKVEHPVSGINPTSMAGVILGPAGSSCCRCGNGCGE